MLKILSVKIILGFGESDYPNYYKKGEGRTLCNALQSILENTGTRVSETEADLISDFNTSLDDLDLTAIEKLKSKNASKRKIKEDKYWAAKEEGNKMPVSVTKYENGDYKRKAKAK